MSLAVKKGADKDACLALGQILAYAVIGGAENLVVQIANEHARVGNPSHVIVLTEPGPLSRRFHSGVHVHYLNYARESIRNPLKFAISIIKGYRLLSKIVNNENLDVIQTHLPDPNLWGLVLAVFNGVKVVPTIHSNKFLATTDSTALGDYFRKVSYRLMTKYCHAIVLVSKKVRESFLEEIGPDARGINRLVVVENGVAIPDTISLAKRRLFRVSLLKPGCENDFLILAAGRLSAAKNFACLIRVAAVLKAQGHRFRVLIAGEGEERGELEDLINDLAIGDRVELMGSIDNLDEVMKAADLLVMTSRWEGLPFVLLEGMAAGLPVVASRIAGISDIIPGEQHGLLVDVDDEQGYAKAISVLFANKVQRREMGEANRIYVQEKYDFCQKYRVISALFEKNLV